VTSGAASGLDGVPCHLLGIYASLPDEARR
jgi:hypothetical protein